MPSNFSSQIHKRISAVRSKPLVGSPMKNLTWRTCVANLLFGGCGLDGLFGGLGADWEVK